MSSGPPLDYAKAARREQRGRSRAETWRYKEPGYRRNKQTGDLELRKPSQAQLGYIEALAIETGRDPVLPTTRYGAQVTIEELLRHRDFLTRQEAKAKRKQQSDRQT